MDAMKVSRSRTGFSEGLLSSNSGRSSHKSVQTHGTINPYATLAAASPTLRPRTTSDAGDRGYVHGNWFSYMGENMRKF